MTSFEDLDRAQQQRVALRSAFRIVTSTVVLVVLYALLPAASNSSAKTLIQLLIGLVVFMGVLGWQVLSILDAEHPEVRAVETLALAVPVLIVVFAFAYLSLSRRSCIELLRAARPRRRRVLRGHRDQHGRVRGHRRPDGRRADRCVRPDPAR